MPQFFKLDLRQCVQCYYDRRELKLPVFIRKCRNDECTVLESSGVLSKLNNATVENFSLFQSSIFSQMDAFFLKNMHFFLKKCALENALNFRIHIKKMQLILWPLYYLSTYFLIDQDYFVLLNPLYHITGPKFKFLPDSITIKEIKFILKLKPNDASIKL